MRRLEPGSKGRIVGGMTNRRIVFANLLLSLGICVFLLWLIYAFKPEEGAGARLLWLPTFNAACNAVSATAVTLGILAIRRGSKKAHVGWMITGTIASAVFLVGYLTHHSVSGDTRFLGEGWIRPLYFFILITHIILAAVALPMILNTLTFAALRRWEAHRHLARWTYPVWLYVSVTGVTIWIFLRLLNPVA